MRRLRGIVARRVLAVALAAALPAVVVAMTGAALTRAVRVTSAARPADAGFAAYYGVPGQIAFVRNGDIFTIRPDGTGLTRLTRGGQASGPRWSPDGTELAYLDAGNLWLMNADGSHKTKLTSAAPFVTDSRPTWSSNGQYLIFVKSVRDAAYGYLTRYNLVTGGQVSYTDTIDGRLIRVAAQAAPVAWTYASDGGYFIAFEGAAAQCAPSLYCLDLLGLGTQAQYANGFPSSESSQPGVRFTNPDWYPIRPLFYRDIITTSENCPAGDCTAAGTEFMLSQLVLPGSYQAVFAPDGAYLAYVMNANRTPQIYTVPSTPQGPSGSPTKLASGTEPDWQPLPG